MEKLSKNEIDKILETEKINKLLILKQTYIILCRYCKNNAFYRENRGIPKTA